MTEFIRQIISGILLFSNDLPWFMMYRAERQKKQAEANKVVLESDQLRIDLRQDQFDYRNTPLSSQKRFIKAWLNRLNDLKFIV
ncbi:MAG: hypothetical protein LBC40_05715 [Dysgonamonadaceae bacterium]|jgi:hypothetical protein|nr:hypothetical protein [Dysgonamonadaceae bacterium]